MPKTKLLTGVFLSIILVSSAATSVQAISLGGLKAKVKDKIEVRQEVRQENREEVREENRESIQERKTEKIELRVTGKAENQELKITAKAESAQERLTKMVTRITDRLENHDKFLANWLSRAKARNEIRKANPKATKTAEIDALLATATSSLATATASKNTAIGLLQGLTVENWKAQDATAKAAKAAVLAAQTSYAKVIKDFKLALEALKKSVN